MWCYQKPGFEALLVAALQRQQQHRQFCDTLLRAEGVSVPTHSCVLSAISPQLSTALSSSPARPAGREHLLEFGTVGTRALLHVVRLLYSGEMAAEGESEKHEAVSAAAKLGILGLVEVTRKQWQGHAGTEVGVQTDPVELSEKEFVCWRGEVRAGSAVIWNETLSSGKKDALTETEAMQASSTSSCKSVPAYETIDMAQFKNLGQADNHAVLPNVPAPLIYLLNEAQNLQTSLVAEHSDTPRVVDSQSYLFSNPQAEARALGGERAELEQFHNDIPGFINHFFNPNSEEPLHTGRTKKKPPGRAKRRGGGERPARTPQARRGGRRRGGWTQTVDVQEVGVSRQHKSLLQRCGMATLMRTGQGGGTTGRKLHLKTRHALGLLCSPQRRRRRPRVWDFCPSEQSHNLMKAGDNVKRHRRNETPQDTQVSHTALRPSPAPHVAPPERFGRLFDEVMNDMEVELSSSVPHSQPPAAAQNCSGTIASCGGNTDNPARSCVHGFMEVVTTGRTDGEAVLVEPQVEVDLRALFEDFLQSFEQHGNNRVSRETQEVKGGSHFPHPQQRRDETMSSHSITRRETSLNSTGRVKATRKCRRKKEHPVQAKERIHESVKNVITQIDGGRGDESLQCTPMVELNRRKSLHPASCQAVKSPPRPKTKSSSKHQPVTVIGHYLLRSRYKATGTTDQPHLEKVWSQLDQPVGKRGRTKKKTRLPCEVECDTLEVVEERCKNNATVEEAATRAAKRRAQPEEKTRHFSREAKRKCLEPNVLLPVKLSVEPTVLANTGDNACKEETTVVEHNKDLDTMNAEVSLGTGSEEYDIDVMGALGSIPDPVSITWSLSSESEEKEEADEEIDVVGSADLTSSPVAFTVSNAVNSMCHGEVHGR